MTLTSVKPHPIFLAGRWVDSPDVLEVTNPARPDELAGTTYNATDEQYEEAVKAAVRAFEVTRTHAGLRARRDPARDQQRHPRAPRGACPDHDTRIGKPIRDALVEVDRAVITFRLGAEEAERMTGEMIPLDIAASSKGRLGITRRFPIGPIAAISPFNFPLNLAAHKLSPAIAAGNTIVLKPPSKDPLTMLDRGRDHRALGRARGRGQHPADDARPWAIAWSRTSASSCSPSPGRRPSAGA